MDQLEQARKEIDEVDRLVAELFCRRMKAVEQVAQYKMEHGLPIFDAKREEAVIQKNSARVTEDELRPYYVSFLQDMMKTSRAYQASRLHGMRVAFSGVEGAFASIAAAKIFPFAQRIPHADFASAYRAVAEGDCDLAVLPIENSTAGEVGQVVDMLFSGSLFVTGIYDLPVHQHLLGLPNAHRSQITKVVSHPQALAQCETYIKERGFSQTTCENTALAAKEVAENGDPQVAAIASEETAALYGLKILERNINQEALNTTRFAVLSRCLPQESTSGRHSILLFTVRNEAGSLAKAVSIIGERGFNMRCLRSRPMKDLLWQYYFYVEVEGELSTPEGQQMMDELKVCCDKLKQAGSFRFPAVLE